MKRQGIVGVIHEATYPSFVRTQSIWTGNGALQAGLLWGAITYANGSDPVRQADHFLSVVSSSWAQANPAVRPSAGVLLYSISRKNGHYPGGTMRPIKPLCLLSAFARAPVYIRIYSGEYHLAQVLNSARVTPAQRKTLTIAGYGSQITPRNRVQLRRGVTGLSGNTAVTVNAACRVLLTQ